MEMKVYNMVSARSGGEVANQFEIHAGNKTYFQSYSSVCAKVENGKVTLGKDWNYSTTTLRYLHQFLRKFGIDASAKELAKMITEGVIEYDSDMC